MPPGSKTINNLSPGLKYGLLASCDQTFDLSKVISISTAISSYSNNAIGVYGASDSSIGIYGASKSGYGVAGISDSAYGIIGNSTSSVAVYGLSHSSIGLSGDSLTGVPLHLGPGSPDGTYIPSPGDIWVDDSGNGKLWMYVTNGWKSVSFS